MDSLEIWKDVVGYEGYYRVSSFGKIFSWKKEKDLSPVDNGIGYLILTLSVGSKKSFLVHRLVAIAFIPNPLGLPDVNHKDGNKKNNRVDNLEWVSRKQNVKHLRDVLGFDFSQINKDKVGALNWNSKAVNQYDMDGNYIATYGSTTEAYRKTGIDFSSIQKVCKGKRPHAGYYKWEYVGR